MTTRKSEDNPASERQDAAVSPVRERVWELHLRGLPKARIAREVGIHRGTVARYLQACYREVGSERRDRLEQKLSAAVARMRRIQEQAWEDHDVDDERERAVLGAMLCGDAGDGDEGRDAVPDGKDAGRGDGKDAGKGRAMVRYQSQRSQYLRLALDAEKEIARLEGLYEASGDETGAVVFRIERLAAGVVAITSDTNSDSSAGGGDDGDDG